MQHGDENLQILNRSTGDRDWVIFGWFQSGVEMIIAHQFEASTVAYLRSFFPDNKGPNV
jgi:hypothetical protein